MSDTEKAGKRLQQLKSFLLRREYPKTVINKAFFNASLQGPAPVPKDKNVLPFVTTNVSNFQCHNIVMETHNMLKNVKTVE